MRNDEEERFNELEEEQYEAQEETDAELAATESEAPAMAGAPVTPGHPESATASGPYVSEDGAVIVIPKGAHGAPILLNLTHRQQPPVQHEVSSETV